MIKKIVLVAALAVSAASCSSASQRFAPADPNATTTLSATDKAELGKWVKDVLPGYRNAVKGQTAFIREHWDEDGPMWCKNLATNLTNEDRLIGRVEGQRMPVTEFYYDLDDAVQKVIDVATECSEPGATLETVNRLWGPEVALLKLLDKIEAAAK